jgi:glycosyltransferase involved in cell wall biosynthesis
MKKILIITATLNFGGAERTVVDSAKALAKNGKYHPIVCSLLDKGEMKKEIEKSGIEYVSPGFKKVKNAIPNLIAIRRLIKKIRPDIIHAHQFASDFYGSIGAIWLKIPIISHIHNPDMPQPLSRKIARYVLSRWLINYFILTIENESEWFEKNIPLAKEKISILHNAVDQKNLSLPDGFDKKKMRSELNIPEKNFIIGSVGRIVWEKGYDLLLSAFKNILEKHPDSFLILVGDGPELKKLKNMARKLNIFDKVIFAGYRQDAAKWISLFDIFVASSKMESFSLASLEAMHLGTPVIITDHFSSKDILSRASMVVPCSDKGIIEGIEKLMENPELRKEMSEKGNKMIKEEFSMDFYAEKLEKIYDKVLAKKQ